MAGEVIDKGTVLMEDGKIQGVGRKLAIPEDGKVVDAQKG